jgi:hypothetical protein
MDIKLITDGRKFAGLTIFFPCSSSLHYQFANEKFSAYHLGRFKKERGEKKRKKLIT